MWSSQKTDYEMSPSQLLGNSPINNEDILNIRKTIYVRLDIFAVWSAHMESNVLRESHERYKIDFVVAVW